MGDTDDKQTVLIVGAGKPGLASAAATAIRERLPHVNVGTVGHIDHGDLPDEEVISLLCHSRKFVEEDLLHKDVVLDPEKHNPSFRTKRSRNSGVRNMKRKAKKAKRKRR